MFWNQIGDGHNTVNVHNVAKLHTIKWQILRYVKFTTVFFFFKKKHPMAWWGLTLPFLASSLLAFAAVAFGQLSNDCSPSPPEERKKKKKCEDPSAFFAPAPRDEGANLVTGGMIRITSGSVEICSSGTYHTQGPVLDSGAKKEPAFFNKHADIHKL